MSSHEDRAKIFQHRGSQAVRLPRAYRFEGQREVIVRREGDRVILEPVRRTWSKAFLDLAGSVPDFPHPAEPGPPDAGPAVE